MKRLILWVPFVLFSIIGIVVAINLANPADRVISSQNGIEWQRHAGE